MEFRLIQRLSTAVGLCSRRLDHKLCLSRSLKDTGKKPPTRIEPPTLTESEGALRQSLLARATLAETAGGKINILDAKRDLILRKRQAIAEAAAQKAAEQAAPPPLVDPSLPSVQKSKETPLLEVLRERLRLGPMPVSEYIGLALSHPKHGYYTTRSVFGPSGDFITAPEISQVLAAPWLKLLEVLRKQMRQEQPIRSWPKTRLPHHRPRISIPSICQPLLRALHPLPSVSTTAASRPPPHSSTCGTRACARPS
jgi:hypothetical protein